MKWHRKKWTIELREKDVGKGENNLKALDIQKELGPIKIHFWGHGLETIQERILSTC